ncbi:MAG: CYTH domain-containing protein [Candidatus Sulfotelmatobacter sp.]
MRSGAIETPHFRTGSRRAYPLRKSRRRGRARFTLSGRPHPDPLILYDILAATLGTTDVVKKTRTLYLIGQTRVHVDEVRGLGEFLEIEVVLRPGQSEVEAKSIATALLSEFGIGQEQLIAEAYVDLLALQARQTGN